MVVCGAAAASGRAAETIAARCLVIACGGVTYPETGSDGSLQKLLAADLEAGAPRNEDGTINLVEFAAWIVKGDEANADQSE